MGLKQLTKHQFFNQNLTIKTQIGKIEFDQISWINYKILKALIFGSKVGKMVD